MPLFMDSEDFNNVVSTLQKWRDNTSYSLPKFTKPALIESPMFIDESLVEEEIITYTIKSLYNIYIGYISMALNLNQYVVGNRTIRDISSVVSTDSYLSSSSESLYITNESLIEDFKNNKIKYAKEADNMRILEEAKNVAIPGGRVIELKIVNPNDYRQSFRIPFLIKFNPRFIDSNIMGYVVSANFETPFMRKVLQLRAGEIKFFRDFVFQLDKIKERQNALKSDVNNNLRDIFKNKRKSITRAILRMFNINASQNIFNSVFIFDKDRFMEKAHNAGLNFNDYNKRQSFMNSIAALFIILIDTKYSLVDMYTHSIPSYGEYTYRSMKTMGSTDRMSISEIMDVMQKNQFPKF